MSYLQVRRKRIMLGKHEVNQDLINPSTSSSFYPPSAKKDAPGTVEEDATWRTRCSWYYTSAWAARPFPSQCATVPFTITTVLSNQWSRELPPLTGNRQQDMAPYWMWFVVSYGKHWKYPLCGALKWQCCRCTDCWVHHFLFRGALFLPDRKRSIVWWSLSEQREESWNHLWEDGRLLAMTKGPPTLSRVKGAIDRMINLEP